MYKLIPFKTLFHEMLHGIIAIPFASVVLLKTDSIVLALVCILVSYLIDLDHFFDYFLYYGLKVNLIKFFKMDYFRLARRTIVPFHGWEWLLLLMVISIGKEWNSAERIILMAYIPHLLLDSLNVKSLRYYSFIYRFLYDFKAKV